MNEQELIIKQQEILATLLPEWNTKEKRFVFFWSVYELNFDYRPHIVNTINFGDKKIINKLTTDIDIFHMNIREIAECPHTYWSLEDVEIGRGCVNSYWSCDVCGLTRSYQLNSGEVFELIEDTTYYEASDNEDNDIPYDNLKALYCKAHESIVNLSRAFDGLAIRDKHTDETKALQEIVQKKIDEIEQWATDWNLSIEDCE